MNLAQVQFELAGQTWWWAGVTAVSAVALLVYAGLLLREKRQAERPADTARIINTPFIHEAPLTLFNLPLWFVSLLAGAGSLVITALVLLLSDRATHLVALVWSAAVLVLAIFLFYARVYRYLSKPRMITLFSLRVLGLLLLLSLLFQPVLGFIKAPDNKLPIAIVIDASASMSIADQPNEPNRYRQSVLAAQNTLLPRLAEKYHLHFFAYDTKQTAALPSADTLGQVSPAGNSTDLNAALHLADSVNPQHVVFFSDGIHNGPAGISTGLASVKNPIHAVRVGSSDIEPATVPDIAVVSIDGPATATVNNTVTLTATIKSTAMSDRTIKVQMLRKEDKSPVDEQRLVLRSGPTPQTVQLKFSPDKVGRTSVRVSVPVDPGERSEANNVQEFPLLVTDPKLAVLYIEGRVRPEVGPLRRALESDPNMNAISMVQTQAGRFDMRGVKEGDELKGLPTTLAQWKRFKVVILGDLDATFLNAQQQKDLEQAVREGTGLLMIGGQRSFAPGGWGSTTLAKMLPVSLDKVEPNQINAKFVPQLTGPGVAHPIFRNVAQFFISPEGNKSPTQMPELSGCVALAGAKAGAQILAQHPTEKINGAPAIVLAVQQYGQGRTAAFAADTTWQWQLFLRGMGKDSPYHRFWGQMFRWLASQDDLQKKTGPSVTAMIAKERYEAGEPVLLRAAVTDKEGQSTNFATVFATVTGPDGKQTKLTLSTVQDQMGLYEVTYQPQLAGGFKVDFGATKDGDSLGADASNFSVLQAAGERDVLAAQPMTLQEIARTTGGSYVEIANISALADRLAAQAPESALATKTIIPLSYPRPFFLGFIVLLALEWFLRRKWQLQ